MNHIPRALAVLAVLAVTPPIAAQTAYLVKDITPGSQFPLSSNPDSMWSFQGKVLFAANESSSGRELWITDGTGSGTRLLADFCPGTCSSAPRPLGTARSLLFGMTLPNFPPDTTTDPPGGFLWRSDGTREGTFLLPDSLGQVVLSYAVQDPDSIDGLKVSIVFGSDAVYFAACNTQPVKCGVWRTDGTAAGTVKLNELTTGNIPSDLTLVGNRLFFASYHQLWMSDGTPGGTTLFKQFPNGTPRNLAALGNKVLFLAPADAPGSGDELWVSDGTAAGTLALTSFEAAAPFEQTRFLKTLGDRVYFVADDVTHGAEIYASDGTAAGTVRITDFGFNNPFGWDGRFDDGGLFASQIVKLGNRLIFWATDGIHPYQPWSNLGTLASTASLCTGCAFGHDTFFQPLNGRVVFLADRGLNDFELWASDGTPQGTQMLQKPCLGCRSPELSPAAGALFYRGPGAADLSSALWTTDGTPAGTRRFAAEEPSSFFTHFAVASLGGKILFGAWAGSDSDNADGELWSSDGTPEGTRQVTDIDRSGNPTVISQLVTAGERVFFTASEDGGDTSRVWRSAGTAADTLVSPDPLLLNFVVTSRLAAAGGKAFLIRSEGTSVDQLWSVGPDGATQQLTALPTGYTIADFVSFQGKLFFGVVHRFDSFFELWQSDGTLLGTHKALDLPAGTAGVRGLRVLGSQLWFLAVDDASRAAIWRTDGTTAGTSKILDGFFGEPEVDPELTQIGSQVFFIVDRPGGPGYDFQVWKSDGTPAGTSPLTNFPVSRPFPAFPSGLTVFQGNLYFFATLPDGPRALWRSDGSLAGLALVRPFLKPPIFDNSRFSLTALASHLVFAVDDGVHGREPWASDGTPAGTALLKDVFPGANGSAVTSFTAAAGQLYFAARDGGHGTELWRTDGTPGGTRLLQDLAPEGASSYPANFAVAGNLLFFSADDGISGNELWALPLSATGCQPSAAALCLNAGRFAVTAHWKTPDGNEGAGTAVPLSADTGYFWFFGPANVEAILKVLDGRSLNDHFWVFYGALSNVDYTLTVTDTQTGLARRYQNSQGQFASVGDTTSFGPLGAYDRKSISAVAAPSPPPLIAERIDLAAATGTCVPAAGRLCLNNGRFAVEAAWKDFANHTGTGTAVGLTGDTGYFWFFDPSNVEAVLKVLDGTTVNGHFWVYYGALSNVEYTLTVTDTMTGHVKTYRNPSGRFASAGDTLAF